MYGFSIKNNNGNFQLDATLFPYELAATARYTGTGATASFTCKRSFSPSTTVPVPEIPYITSLQGDLSNYNSGSYNNVWDTDMIDAFPIVLFRPDNYGTSFSNLANKTNGGNPLVNTGSNSKFSASNTGDVRIYLPSHHRTVGALTIQVNSGPISSLTTIANDTGDYGMVLYDSTGRAIYDSRHNPLLFNRLLNKKLTALTGNSITYTPLDRRPWIMLNSVNGGQGNGGATTPLVGTLVSDGELSIDGMPDYSGGYGLSVIGLM